jgi:UDP-2,3-diacylglucosamine pyrophosphatase LpxH
MSKTLIISDCHISNGATYSWFHAKERDLLTGWLAAATNDADVNEIVLLGDFFDLWLYPINQAPWTVAQIVVNNPDATAVVAALQSFMAPGRSVYYINGNHDMAVTQNDLAAAIPGVELKGYAAECASLHLEHGHLADMFNAPPDAGDDTLGGYPLGYFITRLVAIAEDQNAVWRGLRDALRAFSVYHSAISVQAADTSRALGLRGINIPQWIGSQLVKVVMDFIQGATGVSDGVSIIFPSAPPGAAPAGATVGDIRKHYSDLIKKWIASYPQVSDLLRTMVATESLDWYAEKLHGTTAAGKTIVMGHTHQAVAPNDYYYNDGDWCDSSLLVSGCPTPHFVVIDTATGNRMKAWPTSPPI